MSKNVNQTDVNLKMKFMKKIADNAMAETKSEWPGGWPPCIGLLYQPEHPNIKKANEVKEKG